MALNSVAAGTHYHDYVVITINKYYYFVGLLFNQARRRPCKMYWLSDIKSAQVNRFATLINNIYPHSTWVNMLYMRVRVPANHDDTSNWFNKNIN